MSSVPPNPTPNPATRPAPQIPRAVPPKSNNRFIMAASAIGLGAAGYYFYTAGGDATVAKKKVEEDGHRLVDSLPGKFQGHPHEKAAEVNLAQAGAKIDRAAAEGKAKIQEGISEAEKKAQQSKNIVMQKINEADLKVEQKAAEAKGGIMSWFGFK